LAADHLSANLSQRIAMGFTMVVVTDAIESPSGFADKKATDIKNKPPAVHLMDPPTS
jgi:hypothetical protein